MLGEHDRNQAPPLGRRRLSSALTAGAGLLGAAGVVISAAATHRGGGDLATTAGLFCLLHAAAGLAAVAHARVAACPGLFLAAAAALIVGTTLFAGDLAVAGLLNAHPLPVAAPAGGLLMIAGWLVVVVAGLRDAVTAR